MPVIYTRLKLLFSFLLLITLLQFPGQASASKYLWKANDIASNQSTQTQLTDNQNKIIGTVDNDQIRSLLSIKNDLESSIGGNRYTLYITEDSDPNAFATTSNGENVIVFTLGLLRLAGSDNDMLAAVMGHELGHHLRNHLEESYRTNAIVGLAQIIVGAWLEQKTQQKYHVQNLGIDIANLGATMISSKFTRDQEREADAFGFQYMVQAGYDPEGAMRLHEKLKQYGGDGIPFLSSHPQSEERIQNIRQMIAANTGAVRLAQSRSSERQQTNQSTSTSTTYSLKSGDVSNTDYSQAVTAMLSKDYSTALSKFKSSAENGNDNASLHIGYMYRYGTGVSKDESEAVRWYKKAASAGNSSAIAALKEMGVTWDGGNDTLNKPSSEIAQFNSNLDSIGFVDVQRTIKGASITYTNDTAKDAQDRINQAVSAIAKASGCDLVVYSGVAYASKKSDITDLVVSNLRSGGTSISNSGCVSNAKVGFVNVERLLKAKGKYGSSNKDELARLQNQINSVVTRVAESDQYDVVIYSGVAFSSKAIDITDKILSQL